MNKQAALERLTALESEAAALRKVIEQPENKGLWRPEKSSKYWVVSTNGAPDSFTSDNDCWDRATTSRANCFQSRELAEKASALMARANKIIAAALQADPDAGCRSPSRMYSVTFNFESGWDSFSSYHSEASASNVFVHNLHQAQAMADILNAEGVK